jgi:hypothetical protein
MLARVFGCLIPLAQGNQKHADLAELCHDPAFVWVKLFLPSSAESADANDHGIDSSRESTLADEPLNLAGLTIDQARPIALRAPRLLFLFRPTPALTRERAACGARSRSGWRRKSADSEARRYWRTWISG